jgi:hypothetical protein
MRKKSGFISMAIGRKNTKGNGKTLSGQGLIQTMPINEVEPG